ncbi:MAG: hypothetical protein NXI31_04975 [bacterium]|nr:hypothetical protein [bacterium]
MKLSHLAVGVLALLVLGSPALGQSRKKKSKEPEAPDPYQQALEKYEEYIKRDPFKHHTEGRTTLANTRDTRGLATLAADYAKPHAYDEYTRYTLTHLIAKNFNRDEFLPQLKSMRAEFDEEVDMWMWVRFLTIQIDRENDEEAIKIATTAKKYLHRAAAILALGRSRDGRIKDAIVQNCVEFPRKASDRCAILGAMAGALHADRKQVNDPDYRAALTAYIGLLDPKLGLTHVSKIQMSRHLQWILDGPALFVNPEPWLEILSRGQVKKKKKKYETSATPSFFGIETFGERFCYVIDMSDTMCQKIDPSAKPDNVPITGRKRPKRKKGFVPSESDLPWNLIETRWDLAREQLRISLLRLTDDKWFSVIWFGDKAGTLKSCKGLIRATKRNVDRVIAELDSIEPDPAVEGRAPHGVLRGKTNLHGGLQLAFGLSKKGFVEEYGYVHPKVLTEGCDTIFLLSDGAPSWDTFEKKAINYDQEEGVESTEYSNNRQVTSHMNYAGPYVGQDWLEEDVERMNAFRRIRMHCVGLGEANMSLLKGLAKMGNGKWFSMGAKKKK